MVSIGNYLKITVARLYERAPTRDFYLATPVGLIQNHICSIIEEGVHVKFAPTR